MANNPASPAVGDPGSPQRASGEQAVWIALSFMFERSIEAIQHKVMRSQSQSQRTHVMLLRHGNDSARKEVVEDYRKNHLPNHEINSLLARAKALIVKL